MLFKDLQRVMDYAGITSGTNFFSVKNTIENIEKWHIVPILDKPLYNDLNNAYQLITNEDSLSFGQKELLHHCRNIIGSYLCYYFTPKSEIQLSDAGARRTESDKAKTAFQYQITNFRKQHLFEAETHCETLLEYLEENKESYALWTNSAAYQAYNTLFIKTAKEFNQLYPTASPYRNYWALRFKMFDAEELIVKKAIGSNLFNLLKTKELPSFTAEEKLLLDYLKKAIAYLSVAMALPYLSVRFDDNGFTITSEQGRNTNDDLSKLGDAGETKISHLLRKCNSDGSTWLKSATDFIKDNLAAFPSYSNQQNTETETIYNQKTGDASYGLV